MTPLTDDKLAELEQLATLLAPMLPVHVNQKSGGIVTSQPHPFLVVSDAFHRQVAGGSGGDAADLVTALNALPRLIAEVRELRATLGKIDAVRNSIIGTQTVNWSAHVCPLAAALGDAGYGGAGYDVARAEAETLLERRDRAVASEARMREALEDIVHESNTSDTFAMQRDVMLAVARAALGPLWPMTWRQQAEELQERREEQLARAVAAEKALQQIADYPLVSTADYNAADMRGIARAHLASPPSASDEGGRE